MGLRTGLAAPGRRLPDRLDDLHGQVTAQLQAARQAAKAARIAKAIELAPRYRSELLPPAAGPRDSDPQPR